MTFHPALELPLEIHRIRLLIRPKHSARLAPHHAAIFYAMLCDANAIATHSEPALPDGVLLDAPDQAVIACSPEQPVSMGLTFLSPVSSDSVHKRNSLVDGLRALGRKSGPGQSLREFTIDRIEDLNSGKAIQSSGQAIPVSIETLRRQLDAIQGRQSIQLQWTTPLRCSRPKAKRLDGHSFLDDDYCPGQTIANRLCRRLTELGWNADMHAIAFDSNSAPKLRTLANELVWLDIGYGRVDRKTLGGCLGTITIGSESALSDEILAMFILGQYVRIGENTRFGFGAYRIIECGDDAPRCPRTNSLLDRALTSDSIDRVSHDMELGSGVLTQRLSSILDGRYIPDPSYQITIFKPNGGTRVLSIPSLRDRAVARILLAQLAPALDAFLESSSMAYRRGLGRDQAARRLKQFYQQGYRWAVKADFFQFFDHVDHALLGRRLSAYLADDSIVQFLMQTVRGTTHCDQQGIPTGSPLSPILSNVFLDRFDEEILNRGAQLLRYADDFLILCKDEQQARKFHQVAQQEAEQLRLQLNQDKTATLELAQGFRFLGFQFRRNDYWEVEGQNGPQAIEDIGWQSAMPPAKATQELVELPGETSYVNPARNRWLLLGPSVRRVQLQSKQLVIDRGNAEPPLRVAVDQLQSVTAIGKTEIDWHAIDRLSELGVRMDVLDETMQSKVTILSGVPVPDAKGVLAQASLDGDSARRLAISKALIASKINNHAVLGLRYWRQSSGMARELFELTLKASDADSMPALMGIEGRAAAIWYAKFPETLSRGYAFHHRVAPNASDPVNVMLNWSQTILYRWMGSSISKSGLVATLGAMHDDRAGHLALASDLQEPFRHLMDRVVIEATKVIDAREFVEDHDGPFPLVMKPMARVRFLEVLHRCMFREVVGCGQSESHNYWQQTRLMVRDYRRFVIDSSSTFRSFWHPSPISVDARRHLGV